MEDTSGFYKKEDGSWLYAPNIVEAPNYTLVSTHKNDYQYPIDGWTWFDTAPDGYSITQER